MNRLVDPVHFFNHYGEGVLNQATLLAENDRLKKELEDMRNQRNTLARRLRAIAEEN